MLSIFYVCHNVQPITDRVHGNHEPQSQWEYAFDPRKIRFLYKCI